MELGERSGPLGPHAMTQAMRPHYLLYCEALCVAGTARWRFVLRPFGREVFFAAADSEPATEVHRLELLAVVRGLEALDQPSHVTLVTRSSAIRQVICQTLYSEAGLPKHRQPAENLANLRDHDLWKRVERALEFHEIECRAWRPGEVPTANMVAEAVVPSPYPRVLLTRRRASHLLRKWSLAGALRWIRESIFSQIGSAGQSPFTRAA